MEMSVSNPLHVSSLINKMNSYDKDFRFMAINDLILELQNDSVRLDSDCERKLTNEVLKLLEDQNLEVQNQAVKCLSYLIRKIKDTYVVFIIRDLTTKMMQSTNENVCAVSAIGIKTIITDTTTNEINICNVLVSEIPNPLIKQMGEKGISSIRQMEAFDIMSEVLNKFGSRLPKESMHAIFQSCEDQIFSDRVSIRKRAIACMGSFLAISGQNYFDKFLDFLLGNLTFCTDKIKSNNNQDDMKTLIQCISILTKHPNHVSCNINRIFPTLLSILRINTDETQDLVLQTFETLISKCSSNMSLYLNDILKIILHSIAYDPNYHYDEEDEGSNNTMEYEDNEDDGEDYDNDELLYSDDDDLSWKVRRSALKCLDTFIMTYPDMLKDIITLIGPALVDRFKEREDTVKKEILQCLLTLLKQIGTISKQSKYWSNGSDINEFQKQTSILIQSMLEKVKRQSRTKNYLIRQQFFSLLQEATIASPNCFYISMGVVINIALYTLHEKVQNANLKFDALHFLVELLNGHPDVKFSQYFLDLTKVASMFMNDPFYRLSLESLDLSIILINRAKQQNHSSTVVQIYPMLFRVIRTRNADFEIKEKSINTMTALLCNLGNELEKEQRAETLNVLIERLQNELVRMVILKAFTNIAKNQNNVTLSNEYVHSISSTITPFLCKNDRLLRLETLHCLEALWLTYGDSNRDQSTLMNSVLNMLPPLISDSDLYMAQCSLSLCTVLFKLNCHKISDLLWDSLMPKLMLLLQSPLLHGNTFDSLVELVVTISKLGVFGDKDITECILVRTVRSPMIDCIHREVYPHIARCLAEVIVKYDDRSKIDEFIKNFYNSSMFNNKTECTSHQYLSIMTLGEIGRYVDMSSRKNVLDSLLNVFQWGHDTLKHAAAYSLGRMAQNRLDVFIPYILSTIDMYSAYKYFLLKALKEVIFSLSNQNKQNIEDFKKHGQTVWNLLMLNTSSPEEGIRNIVSECIGHMVLIDPHTLMPKLKELLKIRPETGGDKTQNIALSKATIITAIKYTIVSVPGHPVDQYLRRLEFLSSLQDRQDLTVQRAGLITLNTIIHNKPSLIRGILTDISKESESTDNLLSWLYDATKVRKELIREVEMGPFKHMEDDGLDLRKCAFECISNLLDNYITDTNILIFMDRIEEGLKDNSEIKLLCYPMLTSIAKHYPNKFLDRLPSILPTIRNLLNSRPKHDAVKQEHEKLDEQKKASVKFLVLLLSNEHFLHCTILIEFINSYMSGPLKSMFNSEQAQLKQKHKF